MKGSQVMPASHYVSRFHLREFCDTESLGTPDPWLWVGTISDNSIRRRAPKNIGTAVDLFDGPGGFPDPDVTIERFLANEVEGPAAQALHRVGVAGQEWRELPAELMRYLAWAASRALPVQRLERKWAELLGTAGPYAEPPPPGMSNLVDRGRPVRLLHPALNGTTLASGENANRLFDEGWVPDPGDRTNFLEGAHIQAYYFQIRWFPRLRWFTLRPPTGEYFVIGDRPVGWGVPGCINAPPSCLRDPGAFLIAPITRSLALVGRNSSAPWQVTPAQVNSVLARWSHEWIAGPTPSVVARALRDRCSLDDSSNDLA